MHNRIYRAADCYYEMLANTWQEINHHLNVCCSTNSAHIEIYCTHKKLCKVQCLKMYLFLQYALWLKLCFILPF